MRRLYILVVLVAGLAFTATACSSGRYNRYPYGDRYERANYGNGYDRVRQLAYDLERTTDYLKDQVKDNRYNRGSNYIKDRIEDFDDEAEDFLNEVNHNRDPRKTQDDFRDLQRKYFEARNSLQGGYGYGNGNYTYLYRDFERTNRIMSELSRFYGNDNYSDYRRY